MSPPGDEFFEEHFDHFAAVRAQFIERLTLAVRSREAGHPTHEQAGIRIPLDKGGERLHAHILARMLVDAGLPAPFRQVEGVGRRGCER